LSDKENLINSKTLFSLVELTTFNSWGFAPDPTYFLLLKAESKQRSSRLRPAHSKNYAMRAKKSELALPAGQCFKQQIFLNARCACFSARRPMPVAHTNRFFKTSYFYRTRMVLIIVFIFIKIFRLLVLILFLAEYKSLLAFTK